MRQIKVTIPEIKETQKDITSIILIAEFYQNSSLLVHQSRQLTFMMNQKTQQPPQSFLILQQHIQANITLTIYFQNKSGEVLSKSVQAIKLDQTSNFNYSQTTFSVNLSIGEQINIQQSIISTKLSLSTFQISQFLGQFGPFYDQIRIVFRIGNYQVAKKYNNTTIILDLLTIDTSTPILEIQALLAGVWINLLKIQLEDIQQLKQNPGTYRFTQTLQTLQLTKSQFKLIDCLKQQDLQSLEKEMLAQNYLNHHQDNIKYKIKNAEKSLQNYCKIMDKGSKIDYDYQKLVDENLLLNIEFSLQISFQFSDKQCGPAFLNKISYENSQKSDKTFPILSKQLQFVQKQSLRDAFAVAIFRSEEKFIEVVNNRNFSKVGIKGKNGDYSIKISDSQIFASGIGRFEGEPVGGVTECFRDVFPIMLYLPDKLAVQRITNQVFKVQIGNKSFVKGYKEILDIISIRSEECVIQLQSADSQVVNMQIKFLLDVVQSQVEIQEVKASQQENNVQKQSYSNNMQLINPQREVISQHTDIGMKTLAVEEDIIPKSVILKQQKLESIEALLLQYQIENQKLKEENENLKALQNPYFNKEIDIDLTDPQFFDRQNEVLNIADFNIVQYYTGLDLVPREISNKQELMHFLANSCSTKRLTYAVANLANEISLISKDASNTKIKNQRVQDDLITEQENIIQSMEKKIFQFTQLLSQQQPHHLPLQERKITSQRSQKPPSVLPKLSRNTFSDDNQVDSDIQQALNMVKQSKK